jgi:hypothetical protein
MIEQRQSSMVPQRRCLRMPYLLCWRRHSYQEAGCTYCAGGQVIATGQRPSRRLVMSNWHFVTAPDRSTRRLMRRLGTLEAIGAEGFGLAAKMANAIDHSNALHRTYAPVDEAAVQNVDEARLRGRRKLRVVNKTGGKASPEQPTQVSPVKPRNG